MRARPAVIGLLVLVLMLASGSAAQAQQGSLLPTARASSTSQRTTSGFGCQLGPAMICIPDIPGLIGDIGEDVVGTAADAVMDGIVDWAANGAAWLLRTIGREVDRSTRPQLGSPWFAERYSAMRQLAILLALAFLLAAIAGAALRGDLRLLARCCFVALPAAVLLMFAAVTLVELALSLTDEMSAAVLRNGGGDVRESFADLAKVLLPASAGTGGVLPGFLIFIGAVLTALLTMLVWLELVLREAAVYLAVAFLPLTLAAAIWPRTLHWSQRLAGWLTALILAKLTIATAFSLAGTMIAHARPGSGGLSALLAGCAVLLLAAASPWILLRLIPFTASANGMHRTDLGGALRGTPGVGLAILASRGAVRGAGTAAAANRGSGPKGPGTWAPAPARSSEPTDTSR